MGLSRPDSVSNSGSPVLELETNIDAAGQDPQPLAQGGVSAEAVAEAKSGVQTHLAQSASREPTGQRAGDGQPANSKESGWVHGVLGAASFIPGPGSLAAVADAALYAKEGDTANAVMSGISAIPGGKIAATLGKLFKGAGALLKGTKVAAQAAEDLKKADDIAKGAQKLDEAVKAEGAGGKAAQTQGPGGKGPGGPNSGSEPPSGPPPKEPQTMPSSKPPNRSQWRTEPTGEPGGKPIGEPKRLGSNDAVTKRSLELENKTGDKLADAGYRAERNPALTASDGVAKGKKPDLRVEGKIFDVYAPNKADAKSVVGKIFEKVNTDQAKRIVLNLEDSKLSRSEIRAQLKKELEAPGMGDNLHEILLLDKDGSITHFYPFQN